MSATQVAIRRYMPDDVDPLYEAVIESHAQLSPWLPWCHAIYGRDDAQGWVDARDSAWTNRVEYSFVIADNAGRLLGGVGINRIDTLDQTGNLGYWVRTSAAGRGVATAAAQQVCDAAFRDFGLHRLEIMASVDNRASQRVAEKLSAVREGVLRERLLVQGKRHDVVLYSLVASDW